MAETPEVQFQNDPRQVCEKLSQLGKSFSVRPGRSGNSQLTEFQFRMLPDESFYSLEQEFIEETLVAIAMADAYLQDLITLNDLGLARISRVIKVLENVQNGTRLSPEGK